MRPGTAGRQSTTKAVPRNRTPKSSALRYLPQLFPSVIGKARAFLWQAWVLWTTGLMVPEAYVLKAAVDGWMMKEKGQSVIKRAAAAYNKYQKCGSNAALRLFSTGW
jgi:hypothetical protein